MKKMVIFEVDEEKIKQVESTFEDELGWLVESGIIVVQIIENEI